MIFRQNAGQKLNNKLLTTNDGGHYCNSSVENPDK